jgi:hypothetical protein
MPLLIKSADSLKEAFREGDVTRIEVFPTGRHSHSCTVVGDSSTKPDGETGRFGFEQVMLIYREFVPASTNDMVWVKTMEAKMLF